MYREFLLNLPDKYLLILIYLAIFRCLYFDEFYVFCLLYLKFNISLIHIILFSIISAPNIFYVS